MIPERAVAPLAGAWIETAAHQGRPIYRLVAPLAGAWIETRRCDGLARGSGVAPLAGAWIETMNIGQHHALMASRPSRARGLKPCYRQDIEQYEKSRPSRARGLKQIIVPN